MAEPASDCPADGAGWDEPIPVTFSAARGCAFPIQVFPDWVRDMIDASSTFRSTDPAMAAVTALSVLSACIAGRIEIQIRERFIEPSNLYTAVFADPGERKSPVFNDMTKPMFEADYTLQENAEGNFVEQATLKEIADSTAEHAKRAAAKAPSDKQAELNAAAVAAADHAAALELPAPPQLLVDGHTPESLAKLMANNDGRIAVMSDEGGIFDAMAGQYSAKTNLDIYLKGHTGASLGNLRITRDADAIPKPILTIGVMAQPEVLRVFGRNKEFSGRGLVQRFLFSFPKSNKGYRPPNPPCIPTEVRDRYHARLNQLAIQFATELTKTQVIEMTPEASAVSTEQAERIEIQLRPGGQFTEMAEWANKLRGHTARIAAVLHMAHYPDDGHTRLVEASTMTDAVDVARYFVANHHIALDTIAGTTVETPAGYVLNKLVEHKMYAFNRREVLRRTQRRLSSATAVADCLAELTEKGWVRQVESNAYRLHPNAAWHHAEAGKAAA